MQQEFWFCELYKTVTVAHQRWTLNFTFRFVNFAPCFTFSCSFSGTWNSFRRKICSSPVPGIRRWVCESFLLRCGEVLWCNVVWNGVEGDVIWNYSVQWVVTLVRVCIDVNRLKRDSSETPYPICQFASEITLFVYTCAVRGWSMHSIVRQSAGYGEFYAHFSSYSKSHSISSLINTIITYQLLYILRSSRCGTCGSPTPPPRCLSLSGFTPWTLKGRFW